MRQRLVFDIDFQQASQRFRAIHKHF
jgi:hypothetical protein